MRMVVGNTVFPPILFVLSKNISQFKLTLAHCPDGPQDSIIWCYSGQPSKMGREIYFFLVIRASVYLVGSKKAYYS